MKYFLLILVVLQQMSSQYYNPNKYRKVIGILTNPNQYLNIPDQYGDQAQIGFIDKPYVDSFMQVGLRIYAIPYWKPRSFLKKMFRKTNGMFLQGGVSAYNPKQEKDNISYKIFQRTVQYLIGLAYKTNKQGQFYPLVGTCLGFQEILMYFFRSNKFLSRVNDLDVSNNIIPTKMFYKIGFYSRLVKVMQNFIIKNKGSLYYNHHNGLLKSTYLKNKRVRKELVILGYSKHKKFTFVSAFKHRKYPIMGFQNHFEKAQFIETPNSNIEITTNNLILNFELSMYISRLVQKNKFNTRNMSAYKRYDLYITQTMIQHHHYTPNVYAFIWDLKTRRIMNLQYLTLQNVQDAKDRLTEFDIDYDNKE